MEIPLIPIPLRQCLVANLPASPGQQSYVDVSGFGPGLPLNVYLGSTLIAAGWSDSNGMARIPIAAPAITTSGSRLVTVLVSGTAINETCGLAMGG